MDLKMFMPTKVYGSYDAANAAQQDIAKLGKRALIVTGGNSAKLSGALDDITGLLNRLDIEYTVFDKIGSNPLISACCEAGKVSAQFDADFIIAIGGGSPLDAGKAACVFANNQQLEPIDIFDYTKWENPALPLVAVGTTSGTGSEVTAVAVLTIDETGRKKSIKHKCCYPTIAICNPKYTYSMPYSITVSTALDALSHATEGWFNPNGNMFVDICARDCLPRIWKGLKQLSVLNNDSIIDNEIHDDLYYGSVLAGLILNESGTAFPHPMGYVLTEQFDIPHGRACAAFLPELVRLGIQSATERANEYFELLGCKWPEFSLVVDSLADIQIKMSEEQISSYEARWYNLHNFEITPGGFSPDKATDLLRKLFL